MRKFPGSDHRSAGFQPAVLQTSSLLSAPQPIGLFLAGFLGLSIVAHAAEPTRSQLDFFENKIRPVLANHCYKCHSQKSEKVKGGLTLDTREGVLAGGNSGPVIVPGNPDKSPLIEAIRYTNPDLQMPPKGEKLSEAQVEDLVAWVKMGAPDPRAATAAQKTWVDPTK